MKAGWKFLGLFAAVGLIGGATLFAQDKKDDKKPAGDKPAVKPADTKPAAAADKKEGEPDMAAMMKMFQEMSAPGKEHEALKPMIGSFNCTTKFWQAPGAPPDESTSTAERKWILGGRYMAEEFKGTAMGMPFEGFGVTGYDKLQKHYHGYWVDSMSTGMFTHTGSVDASGKTFTFTGENFDPMTMAKQKTRTTVEIINNDKEVMKMFGPGPDGKEFMNLEITCTRK